MQVNYNDLKRRYKIVLTNLMKSPLGEIAFYEDLTYSPALTSISELTFSLNATMSNEKGEIVPTPFYKELRADMLILIDDKEYFYINTCSEDIEGKLGRKNIHAFSREFELSMKSFNNYEPETERFLYFKKPAANRIGYPWATTIPADNKLNTFLNGDADKYGAFFGIFNEIERITSWRLERDENDFPIIPDSLKYQTRAITTSEMNLLELMQTIQEAWNCYFTYDTKNRRIKIHEISELRTAPNGLLSDENFVLNLTRELKREEVKTRLYLYNKDGVGVTAEKMAHGQPYIENYSYFMTDEYMSTSLQNALKAYFINLQSHQAEAQTIWNNIKALIAERQAAEDIIKEAEENLVAPTVRYEHFKNIRDGYIDEDGTVIAPPRALTEQEAIDFKAASVELNKWAARIKLYSKGRLPDNNATRSLVQIEESYKVFSQQLKDLKNEAWMPMFFRAYEQAQIPPLPVDSLEQELEPYIRDATYQSETIESADDLYVQGLAVMDEISKPHLQFTMNVVDFLSLVEFKEAWNLIKLGQILRVKDSKEGFIDDVILLKYDHNPDSQSLTIEFSNNLHLKNDTTYIAELLAKSNSVASNVSFNTGFWNAGGKSSLLANQNNLYGQLYANEIFTENLVAGSITAAVANIDLLYAKTAEIENLVAGKIEANSIIANKLNALYADIEFANIKQAAIDNLIAGTAFIDTLTADSAFIDKLTTKEAFIDQLTASTAFIHQLTTNMFATEHLIAREAFITNLVADSVFTSKLTADSAFIADLKTSTLFTSYLTANYADIDLASIETGLISTIISTDLLANDGYLANLSVNAAQIVSLDARVINAGTISADKILLKGIGPEGQQGLLLGLNNLGQLVSQNVDSLDGYILTKETITADKIVAHSITADQIQAGTISAMEIKAGSLTTASGVFGDISANYISGGTIDAEKVQITNLSANSIKAGVLRGANEAFFLDVDNGYFNFGNRLVSDANGVKLTLGNNENVEEYIQNKMPHNIFMSPQTNYVLTNNTGSLIQDAVISIDLAIYQATAQIGGLIQGLKIKDSQENVINSPMITSNITPPTATSSGRIVITIDKLISLPTDSGFIEFIVTPNNTTIGYSCRVNWVKAKSPDQPYTLEIYSSAGNVFKDYLINTELSVVAYKGVVNVTDMIDASRFKWTRRSSDISGDIAWNSAHATGSKTIPITHQDIIDTATFTCKLED